MPVALSAPVHHLRERTTAQARPVEWLDYWVGAICGAFLEMDCSSRAADCFEGSLTHLPLDRLAVNRVLASTQDVFRTSASIDRSTSCPFYLITQLDHRLSVAEVGRRCGYSDDSHFGRDFLRATGLSSFRWPQQHLVS